MSKYFFQCISCLQTILRETEKTFLVTIECIFRSDFQNLKETSKRCKYRALCSPVPPKVSFLAVFFSVKTVVFARTGLLGDNCVSGSCLFSERCVSSASVFSCIFLGMRTQSSSCQTIHDAIC